MATAGGSYIGFKGTRAYYNRLLVGMQNKAKLKPTVCAFHLVLVVFNTVRDQPFSEVLGICK